jgi:hypothetical protein
MKLKIKNNTIKTRSLEPVLKTKASKTNTLKFKLKLLKLVTKKKVKKFIVSRTLSKLSKINSVKLLRFKKMYKIVKLNKNYQQFTKKIDKSSSGAFFNGNIESVKVIKKINIIKNPALVPNIPIMDLPFNATPGYWMVAFPNLDNCRWGYIQPEENLGAFIRLFCGIFLRAGKIRELLSILAKVSTISPLALEVRSVVSPIINDTSS